MIRTGVDALDKFLGGSLPRGMILDVYGPGGSGKTQILLQVSAAAAEAGHHVAYIDTTGSFRPERVLEMCRSPGTAVLERMGVFRTTSVSEQTGSLRRLGDGISVLVVDNVTDLFIYEYPGDRRAFARSHLLMSHMSELSRLALAKNIPVVVSNMVRHIGDLELESMGRAIDLFTHVKLHLSGHPEWIALCSRLGAQARFAYSLGRSGVSSKEG